MINQPFNKPKWFTFRETTRFTFKKRKGNREDAPRFVSPADLHYKKEVKYQSFSKDSSEQTIDLRNVTGWKTVPNEQLRKEVVPSHIFELETIDVYLSDETKKITLHNQKGNPEVKLAKYSETTGKMGPMEKITIPQPELTQIDDFFDAMLAANLL